MQSKRLIDIRLRSIGGSSLSCESLVDELDGHCSLTHGRCHAPDTLCSDVADREANELAGEQCSVNPLRTMASAMIAVRLCAGRIVAGVNAQHVPPDRALQGR